MKLFLTYYTSAALYFLPYFLPRNNRLVAFIVIWHCTSFRAFMFLYIYVCHGSANVLLKFEELSWLGRDFTAPRMFRVDDLVGILICDNYSITSIFTCSTNASRPRPTLATTDKISSKGCSHNIRNLGFVFPPT